MTFIPVPAALTATGPEEKRIAEAKAKIIVGKNVVMIVIFIQMKWRHEKDDAHLYTHVLLLREKIAAYGRRRT